MSLKKEELMGISFIKASWPEVEKYLAVLLKSAKKECWFTINPEIVEKSFQDKGLAEILKAHQIFPDGIGVLWAAKMLKNVSLDRLSGIDMLPLLKNKKVYLLGSKASVVGRATEHLQKQGVDVVGFQHGYFDEVEEEIIKEKINELKPDILLVGLGMGKQEKWLARNIDSLNIKLGITIGGSMDVISGLKKRAPLLVRKANLEWLYRLIQEPARIGRQLNLLKFVFRVLLLKTFRK